MSCVDPDDVADCVIDAFYALPAKFKPRALADGRQEWVPLAGIVLSKDECSLQANATDGVSAPHTIPPDTESRSLLACDDLQSANDHTRGFQAQKQNRSRLIKRKRLTCVALATEVLAMRGFQRWILDECADILCHDGAEEESGSRWLKRRKVETISSEVASETTQFEFQDGVQIHMYCSEAPCGDASMEVIAGAMEDATPWDITGPSDTAPSSPENVHLRIEDDPAQIHTTKPLQGSDQKPAVLHGRAFFSLLGIVRRKPSRADAPVSLSKSCSDKLAMKQCTGLLSAITSLFVKPTAAIYLQSLVLPNRAIVREGVDRAFRGRMNGVEGGSLHGYTFRPFEVLSTTRRFTWDKRPDAIASNLCAVVVYPGHAQRERREILINGVLQGRKQLDSRGASILSRRSMWRSALLLAMKSGLPPLLAVLAGRENTYGKLKEAGPLKYREQMKHHVRQRALKGWKRNLGDEDWTLQ